MWGWMYDITSQRGVWVRGRQIGVTLLVTTRMGIWKKRTGVTVLLCDHLFQPEQIQEGHNVTCGDRYLKIIIYIAVLRSRVTNVAYVLCNAFEDFQIKNVRRRIVEVLLAHIELKVGKVKYSQGRSRSHRTHLWSPVCVARRLRVAFAGCDCCKESALGLSRSVDSPAASSDAGRATHSSPRLQQNHTGSWLYRRKLFSVFNFTLTIWRGLKWFSYRNPILTDPKSF